MNDIEKNKRPAPRSEIIKALAGILEADDETINDLAGNSKNVLPPDVAEFIGNNHEVISLVRLIKTYNLTKNDIIGLEKLMTSSNVKAIIIAAGLGSRLKGYTEALPKCMLKFGEKTLLQRQLDAYRECGIKTYQWFAVIKRRK